MSEKEVTDGKPFKRSLPCDLTEEEKVKKGHKAGQIKKSIQKVRAEMKVVTSDHKEKLKELQANLDTLLDMLDTGKEERPVECFERMDFAKKKAVTIRTDTNEEVETRVLQSWEMQTKIKSASDVVDVVKEVIPDVLDQFDVEYGEGAAPKPKKRGRKKA